MPTWVKTSTKLLRIFFALIAEYVPRISESGTETMRPPRVSMSVGPSRRTISLKMS